eukprot:TRINITY_DN4917_c0_g1_i1.p1 TRINITY_DN4917_c0_g1~~TRINITY_DN4917_c0_g1_i1.p1  ORF type:complete len:144 (-),score=40.30 TRINITY_DN4917_c0_g1_i1:833-1264(-)
MADDLDPKVPVEGTQHEEEEEEDRTKPEERTPTPEEQEAALRKKYGGLVPKKPPLISKDHERAYFDSADWALGKTAGDKTGPPGKPKGPVEALRPKLQPTPHQPLPARRASYQEVQAQAAAAAAAANNAARRPEPTQEEEETN